MTEQINRLTDVDTEEVSIVPRGKNGKLIAVAKEQTQALTKSLLAVLSTPAIEDEIEALSAIISKGADETVVATALMRLLTGYADKINIEDFRAIAKASGLDFDASPVAPTLSEVLANTDHAVLNALLKEMGLTTMSDTKVETENKSDDVTVIKATEQLSKENADLRKELADLSGRLIAAEKARRTESLQKEAVTLAVDADQASAVFAVLKGFEPDATAEDRSVARDEFVKSLASNRARIEELTKAATVEVGSTKAGDVSKSPTFDVDFATKVAEIKKSDPSVSDAVAMQRVFNDNPELFNEYRRASTMRPRS